MTIDTVTSSEPLRCACNKTGAECIADKLCGFTMKGREDGARRGKIRNDKLR